jgi:hypothetical protein
MQNLRITYCTVKHLQNVAHKYTRKVVRSVNITCMGDILL